MPLECILLNDNWQFLGTAKLTDEQLLWRNRLLRKKRIHLRWRAVEQVRSECAQIGSQFPTPVERS